MTDYTDAQIWLIIAVMGVATFLIRFSFLGLIGDRKMPDWVLRHLRYTPVAVLPGLVAPLVIWPDATGGATDPARLVAALMTLVVGWSTKSLLCGAAAGGLTFVALEQLF